MSESPTSFQADMPVLDSTVVETLKELGGEDDPSLFNDLVDAFLADSPARIEAIGAALRSNDADGAWKAAHGLKSSAANMGALRLSEVCRSIEADGQAGRIHEPEARIAQLEAQFDAVAAALDQNRS